MTEPALAGFAQFGRRERKRAALRVGLLEVLKERIEAAPFEQITVRELADALNVSEPTFFAQFPTKTALLTYHIHLWRIGAILAVDGADDGRPFLQAFFARTADDIVAGPQLWFEITAEIARGGGLCDPVEISDAERLLAFDDDERALTVDPAPQRALFARHVPAALGTDVRAADVVDDLLGVFYGTPLALGRGRLGELHTAYRHGVDRTLGVLARSAT